MISLNKYQVSEAIEAVKGLSDSQVELQIEKHALYLRLALKSRTDTVSELVRKIKKAKDLVDKDAAMFQKFLNESGANFTKKQLATILKTSESTIESIMTGKNNCNTGFTVNGQDYRYVFISNGTPSAWRGRGRCPLELEDAISENRSGNAEASKEFEITNSEDNIILFATFLADKLSESEIENIEIASLSIDNSGMYGEKQTYKPAKYKYVYRDETGKICAWKGRGKAPLKLAQAQYKQVNLNDSSEMDKYLISASDENKAMFEEFLDEQKSNMNTNKVQGEKKERTPAKYKYVYRDESGEINAWKGRGLAPSELSDAQHKKVKNNDSSEMDQYLISASPENKAMFESFLAKQDLNVSVEGNQKSLAFGS